jgi:hypothetical protein
VIDDTLDTGNLLNLVGLWFRRPHDQRAATTMRTSELPHNVSTATPSSHGRRLRTALRKTIREVAFREVALRDGSLMRLAAQRFANGPAAHGANFGIGTREVVRGEQRYQRHRIVGL